jgi:hypothetical protein
MERLAKAMERNAYLSAIHRAIGALSETRIVLSQAKLRVAESKTMT